MRAESFVAGAIAFLNTNAGAVQALATVVLVLITWWYARTTSALARETRRQAEASEAKLMVESARSQADVKAADAQILVEALRTRRLLGVLTKHFNRAKWLEFQRHLDAQALESLETLAARASPTVQTAAHVAIHELEAWRKSKPPKAANRHQTGVEEGERREAAIVEASVRAGRALDACVKAARDSREG